MIRFTTINVDGIAVPRTFNTLDEMKVDWEREDGTTLPSLDDELVFGEINGVKVTGKTFNDFALEAGLVQ